MGYHQVPDKVALRDALRGVRYVLRRVSTSLHNLPPPPLPGSAMMHKAAKEMSSLTSSLDEAVSTLARSVLVDRFDGSEPHVELKSSTDGARFALALYEGLHAFFRRFGIENQLISELAAKECFERVVSGKPVGTGKLAALLMQQVLDSSVVLGESSVGTGLDKDAVRPLAVFSTLLWLMSSPETDKAEETLLAAQDLAVGVSAELMVAWRARDTTSLAELFDDLSDHV